MSRRDLTLLRLAVALAVTQAGAFAALFVGVWGKAAYLLGATPGQLALLMAASGIGGILAGSVTGTLVDRFGPRTVVLAAEAAIVPAALLMILPSSMPLFTATALLGTLAAGAATVAVSSLAPYLTEEEARLTRINVIVELSSTAGFIVGPAAGAAIAATAGIHAVFVLDAATSAVAFVALWGLPMMALPEGARGRALREAREGMRFAYGEPAVRFCLLAGVALWLSFGVFGGLEALFFRDVLGVGPGTVGWMLSLFGASLAAGAFALDRLPARFRTPRTLAILLALTGGGEVLYVATGSMAVVVAGNIAWGLCMGAATPLVRTLMQAASPRRVVGRVMGAYTMHTRGATLLPLTFTAALAGAVGVRATLVGAGIALSGLAVLLLLPASLRAGGAPAGATEEQAAR